MPGDEAFYYLHEQEELQGKVLTQVHNFTIAGNANFLEKVEKGISDTLTVSKVENISSGSFVGIWKDKGIK